MKLDTCASIWLQKLMMNSNCVSHFNPSLLSDLVVWELPTLLYNTGVLVAISCLNKQNPFGASLACNMVDVTLEGNAGVH